MTKITIQEKFRAAAKFFESVYKKDFGRGFQARVAKKSGVRASYFNEILKGKKDGPEEVRRKLVAGIASICEKAKLFTYESFLEFGEYILLNGSDSDWQNWQVKELDRYLSGDILEGLQKLVNDANELLNNPRFQFHLGIYALLGHTNQEFRDGICSKYNIDTKTLDLFLKGDVCLFFSEQQASQISSEFHLSYNDVLSLGGWLTYGKSMSTWHSKYIPLTARSIKDINHLPQHAAISSNSSPEISEPSSAKYVAHDKNMQLITEWINLQDNPDEYWILLKMLLRREEPEFRNWLKNNSKT